MKCDKCGWSDNGTGDWAHVCGPVTVKPHYSNTNNPIDFPKNESQLPVSEQSLVYRLRKRAEIRRQIKDRKSVQEGARDRIADLLEEAANEIIRLQEIKNG